MFFPLHDFCARQDPLDFENNVYGEWVFKQRTIYVIIYEVYATVPRTHTSTHTHTLKPLKWTSRGSYARVWTKKSPNRLFIQSIEMKMKKISVVLKWHSGLGDNNYTINSKQREMPSYKQFYTSTWYNAATIETVRALNKFTFKKKRKEYLPTLNDSLTRRFFFFLLNFSFLLSAFSYVCIENSSVALLQLDVEKKKKHFAKQQCTIQPSGKWLARVMKSLEDAIWLWEYCNHYTKFKVNYTIHKIGPVCSE